MTKYAIVYKDQNNELIYTGSFIGKNHYRIKFVMYRYLKKLLMSTKQKPIMFAIYEIKSRKFRVYMGKTEEIKSTYIHGIKIKSINKVCKVPKKHADKFIKRIKSQPIPYVKTHAYREEYDSDELSMSETDSEFEEDDNDELSISKTNSELEQN
jgi:hypothetical protein